MIEPLTAGAVAGGGWLLAKLLGPAADEIGDSLREKISKKRKANWREVERLAEQKIDESEIQHQPSLAELIVISENAASEDRKELQELWANLLASVAKFSGVPVNSIAQILKNIRPEEALVIDDLFNWNKGSLSYLKQNQTPRLDRMTSDSFFLHIPKEMPEQPGASDLLDKILGQKCGWPARIVLAYIPTKSFQKGSKSSISSTVTWYHDNSLSLDILRQQGVIEIERHFHQSTWGQSHIDVVSLTSLGMALAQACFPEKLEDM